MMSSRATLDGIERSFDNAPTGSHGFADTPMNDFTPLAFVDVETTGVDPRTNRITEIGVVTVDGDQVEEWTTLVNPSTRSGERRPSPDGVADVDLADAPRFKDFAVDLARRLAGRLFVAHNARFDCGFLKAEFGRIGMEFAPDVLCSVMLSRKLYSQLTHHDLDSVMERHGLQTEARHRALPDAKLIWQFWQIIHQEQPAQSIAHAIEALLAGPVLPVHLDPSLIERLPEAPGVYVLHGERDSVLQVGKASNLKRHLVNYFRMDLTSAKALAISHRISNITWRTTQGMLGAHFQYAALSKTLSPLKRHAASQSLFSWQLVPDACPSMALVSLANGPPPERKNCSASTVPNERHETHCFASLPAIDCVMRCSGFRKRRMHRVSRVLAGRSARRATGTSIVSGTWSTPSRP